MSYGAWGSSNNPGFMIAHTCLNERETRPQIRLAWTVYGSKNEKPSVVCVLIQPCTSRASETSHQM